MNQISGFFAKLAAVPLMGTAALLAQDTCPIADAPLPVVLVHGNGDDAAKWIGIISLFESNGYPSDKLFAVRFSMPVARADDQTEEPARSSTEDATAELSAMVTRVLLKTQSRQVILVGSSRGGLTIRNYILFGGGRNAAACAILAGTPNHGVFSSSANLGNEFNEKGNYLTRLNRSESIQGVPLLTLRSDRLDKFAQPANNAPGAPPSLTGTGADGPALAGANNLVLAGLDHRELAFHPRGFAEMYRFITGHEPLTLEVVAEQHPSLSGLVSGFAGAAPTNLPLSGVTVRIYTIENDAQKRSLAGPLYECVTREDGRWGPFAASSATAYVFELEYRGRRVQYYMAPFLRSTQLLNLRFAPVPAVLKADSGGTYPSGAQLVITRPEGYFSRERDAITINGAPVEQEPSGLPTQDTFVADLPKSDAVQITLRKESISAIPSDDLARDLPIVDFLW